MTTKAEKFRNLSTDLRRRLGAVHPAVDAVVAACHFWCDLPQQLVDIDALATADFETLKKL